MPTFKTASRENHLISSADLYLLVLLAFKEIMLLIHYQEFRLFIHSVNSQSISQSFENVYGFGGTQMIYTACTSAGLFV